MTSGHIYSNGHLGWAVTLCFWVCPIFAGEVLNASVEYDTGRFTIYSDIRIQVPADRVRAILTHYENLPRVNGGIKSVKVLHRRADGSARMRVAAGICILFICREYHWVQEVTTLPSGDILTVIDPAESTFREGQVRYQILPDGDNTRLVTDADLVPNIWFPPVIGPWLIKHKLQSETLETAEGVERIAAQE